ncbi:MAG TPA: bL35 family ribosomal protein [Tepidisphaeraceae bacterium]
MAYKFKPNKSVAKRLKLTRTGKLKRHHGFTSHLMSARPSSRRRKLRRPAILFEGHARNMRKLMGVSGIHPNKIRHERELAAEGKGPEADAPATKAKATATKAAATSAPASKKKRK